MRLRQLEYFVAICEYGSFNAAAEQLLVAQPSLSQQIRALEREVGAELLERGRKGVALTAAGRVFLPRAQSVLAEVEAARRSVADVVGGLEGELHVLTVRSVASGVLPPAIVRWHEQDPATVLRLHGSSHRRVLESGSGSARDPHRVPHYRDPQPAAAPVTRAERPDHPGAGRTTAGSGDDDVEISITGPMMQLSRVPV
jgi:DNA-binding transcriptional LysR family regulator